MACRYTIAGKTYEEEEFKDYLHAMAPAEAAKYMPGVRGMPTMPFEKMWHELAFKRVLRYAAEHGYDQIAWTTGDQQADRYDLSKHISHLQLEDNASGGIGKANLEGPFEHGTIEAWDHNKKRVIDKHIHGEKELVELIGKDAADKLLASTPGHGRRAGLGVRVRSLQGLDLKVGGEGMRGFYDKMLPAFANKIGKKWGAKVGTTEIKLTDMPDSEYENYPVDHPYRQKNKPTVHSLPITPAMRESVMAGQPMFARPKVPQGWGTVDTTPDEKIIRKNSRGQPLKGVSVGEATPEENQAIEAVNKLIHQLAPRAPVQAMRTLSIGGYPIHGAVFHRMAKRLIAWALESTDVLNGKTAPIADLKGTARHEVVHWLRGEGYFYPEEWNALERRAERKDWIGKHQIEARYPSETHTKETQLEEAIAEEARDRRAKDNPDDPSVVRRAFRRLVTLLNRLKAVIERLFGKVSAEEVFRKMESGEVGAREPSPLHGRPAPQRGEMKAQTPEDTKKATLGDVIDGLKRRGWVVDHVSKSEGKPSSYYLSPKGDLTGKKQIRVSGHALGSAHGERQGASWSTNIVLQPELSIADHLAAVENEDYRDGAGGFGEGYSFADWNADQGPRVMAQRPAPPGTPQRRQSATTRLQKPPPNKPPAGGAPKFDDLESEKRWQEARKGAGAGDSFLERAKDWFDYMKAGASRHWIALPDVPKYAELQQQLRRLESAPEATTEDIIRALHKIVGGMTPDDLDLFTRKVVLDDLAYEASIDHKMPFGLSDLDVPRELAKIDAVLKSRPDVGARIDLRKAFVEKVKDALVENGVLDEKRVKNPSYYRHQVLEYASAMAFADKGAGGAKRLRTPKWAKRMGSEKDINANYLEAEFDWLRKAMNDIAAAKTIQWIKDSPHNIRENVRKAAKASNDKFVQKALDDDVKANGYFDQKGRARSPLNDQFGKFRQRIAVGLEGVRLELEDGALKPPKAFEDAADAIQNGTRDDSVMPFLAWILDNNQPGSMGAASAFKAIAARKKWVEDLLGPRYADPNDIKDLVKRGLAPEGYTTWQPDEGKLFFVAKTLPEHMLDNFLGQLAEQTPEQAAVALGLPPHTPKREINAALSQELIDASKEVMAVGGDKYMMVIPEELAATLNSLRNSPDHSLFDAVIRAPLRAWKQWVLINPMRVLKYNLNNLSGDLDAVIAGAPRVMKRLAEATRELKDVMVLKKEPSQRYKDAVDRGVFNAGITVQEIPDINELSEFEHLMAKEKGALGKAMQPAGTVWRTLRKYTTFRENMLRYAAYMDYLDRLNAGEGMEKIGYGASRPDMVDAVSGKEDRAALLARDLVGDYGAISHFGQSLRRTVWPFWSWQEINTRRYWRLTRNAFDQGIGKGIVTGGYLGAGVGVRTTAYLLLRMAALYGLIWLWNNLLFGDEEKELDPQQSRQLHVLLGHDSDGNIRSLRVQGAISDALSWFGFGEAMGALAEVARGRGTVAEVAEAVGKAPINKLAGGVTPVISVPVEMLSGQSYYPDAFNPLPIRDQWREFFRLFSLDPAYDAIMGKPSRGAVYNAEGTLLYQRDPGEIAYDQLRGMTFDWLQKTRGESGVGNATTARGEALRDWRTAARYGDERAGRAAAAKMRELKINGTAIRESLQRAAPLGAIAQKDRNEFLKTLTPAERARLDTAQKWYYQTFVKGAEDALKSYEQAAKP